MVSYIGLNDTFYGDTGLINFSIALSDGVSPDDVQTTGCYGNWVNPNHALYQIAHVALLVGFLAPSTPKGLLALHGCSLLAFLLLSSWSWVMLCAPDIFSWNFSLCWVNMIQLIYIFYHMRPIKFALELEDVYATLFAPLKVTRTQFKKFVSSERCSLLTLHSGETYAAEEVTKTDRLSLLVSGTVNVINHGQFLHQIHENQFLDSPEFESSTHGEDKFHVSIVAANQCRYLCWQRQSLEYLFAKEPYVALVLGHILGRDITNKLYMLNERLKTQKGSRVDIRLPNVSSAAISGIDLRSDTTSQPGSGVIDIRSDIDDIDEEDLLDEINEKMPMFPNGVPLGHQSHPKLHLTLSGSTYSGLSTRMT